METFSEEGLKAVGKFFALFLFVAMFWCLFDQTSSRWVFQAQDMDRNFLGVEWLESQVQAVNPILILTFIPLFTFVVYPFVSKMVRLTPLRKIGAGLFLMGSSFALSSAFRNGLMPGNAQISVGSFWLTLCLPLRKIWYQLLPLSFLTRRRLGR